MVIPYTFPRDADGRFVGRWSDRPDRTAQGHIAGIATCVSWPSHVRL